LDAPNYKGPTHEHDEDDDLPDMRSNNGFGYY
jgi:hypothetical protein